MKPLFSPALFFFKSAMKLHVAVHVCGVSIFVAVPELTAIGSSVIFYRCWNSPICWQLNILNLLDRCSAVPSAVQP